MATFLGVIERIDGTVEESLTGETYITGIPGITGVCTIRTSAEVLVIGVEPEPNLMVVLFIYNNLVLLVWFWWNT